MVSGRAEFLLLEIFGPNPTISTQNFVLGLMNQVSDESADSSKSTRNISFLLFSKPNFSIPRAIFEISGIAHPKQGALRFPEHLHQA